MSRYLFPCIQFNLISLIILVIIIRLIDKNIVDSIEISLKSNRKSIDQFN